MDNVRPDHYKGHGIECWDAMGAFFGLEDEKVFCYTNAFKYLCRFKEKGGLEDIKKAKTYLERYIEMCEG